MGLTLRAFLGLEDAPVCEVALQYVRNGPFVEPAREKSLPPQMRSLLRWYKQFITWADKEYVYADVTVEHHTKRALFYGWEFVTLPERKHYTFTFPRVGFGFDPRSKKYKVARFFYEENLPNSKKYRLVCRFEVLPLGTDSWRQTADPPHWIVGQTPVHVKGYIYWKCVLNQGRMNPSNSFVRFSLADEEFSMVPQSTPSVRFQACPLRGVGGRAVLRLLGLPKPRARGLDLELWGRAEARMESTLGNGDPSS
uniref:F-box associated beta-propeller type 3 domain-containing protein n=1 Tax=Aegilops tauschii TaxID=37682 RepID=N1R1C3_AEGTA